MGDLKGYEETVARFRAMGSVDTGLARQFGAAMVREQKLLVHRKTGTTARTIHISNVTERSVTTQAAAAAVYLERGTRPHVIRPRVAKVLAWGGPRRLTGALRKGAKATNFAKLVHHPGSKAYPFMLPGALKALAQVGFGRAAIDAWNRAR